MLVNHILVNTVLLCMRTQCMAYCVWYVWVLHQSTSSTPSLNSGGFFQPPQYYMKKTARNAQHHMLDRPHCMWLSTHTHTMSPAVQCMPHQASYTPLLLCTTPCKIIHISKHPLFKTPACMRVTPPFKQVTPHVCRQHPRVKKHPHLSRYGCVHWCLACLDPLDCFCIIWCTKHSRPSH